MTAICTCLCHIDRRSPVDIFNEVFEDACVFSRMQIVWLSRGLFVRQVSVLSG